MIDDIPVLWWLRWGWACFSEGGRWRRLRVAWRWRRPVAPGAGASAGVAYGQVIEVVIRQFEFVSP